jgi:hypothetical protein
LGNIPVIESTLAVALIIILPILDTIVDALPIKLPTIDSALLMKLHTFPATSFALFQSRLINLRIWAFK